jgi:hypothetical protein
MVLFEWVKPTWLSGLAGQSDPAHMGLLARGQDRRIPSHGYPGQIRLADDGRLVGDGSRTTPVPWGSDWGQLDGKRLIEVVTGGGLWS